jgi:hypothetical protein
MSSDAINPGSYTIQWMVDTRRASGLQPLRIAQLAAYSLQPRIGTLVGSAVQPSDAEFIINRLTNDNLSGVVRLQVNAATTKTAIGEAILNALRGGGVPDAAPHLGATEWGPASALASPFLAAFALPVGALAAATGESGRQAFRNRFGSVVVRVHPQVDNAVRPASSTSPVGALAGQLSNRVSTDPARNGNVGASSLTEAADAIRQASSLSPTTIAVLATAGAVVFGVLVFAVYQRVSGR